MNYHTFGNICEVSSLNLVIGLHENLAETRLTDGVILQVELVKTMEGILVGLLNP